MNAAATDARQHILDVARPLMLGRGFTAVGLTELLSSAGVPKGSFYHYFASKEAFGQALLDAYFSEYLAHLDDMLARPGTAAERLMGYWRFWLDSHDGQAPDCQCLAVKLGAEVSDLSESMRATLSRGIDGIVQRLARCIADGQAEGSLPASADPQTLASSLYQAWFGATLLVKITRQRAPLDAAMATTRQLLRVDDDAVT